MQRFQVDVERETRVVISLCRFAELLREQAFRITQRIHIEQLWFVRSDKVNARFRKTYFESIEEFKYEQTVKHQAQGGKVILEVTTPLSEKEYQFLTGLYPDVPVTQKDRYYLNMINLPEEGDAKSYNDNFIVTADCVRGEEDKIVIEFELKPGKLPNEVRFPNLDFFKGNS